ncbi:MAG: hypothetical protein WCI94_03240 [Rhodospirillales bacterium]
MSKNGSIRTRLIYTGWVLAVALVGIAAYRWAPHAANLLALWIILSVPLGIAVGHCALNER